MGVVNVCSKMFLAQIWILILISSGWVDSVTAISIDREIPNSGSFIPDYLLPCYENSYLLDRRQRLPLNIETFIAIVRKLEVSLANGFDLRSLSVMLLERFSMEGIIRIPQVVEQSGVVPYAPRGLQVPRHRLLLQKLIQGDGSRFPNETLTLSEQCTLHFMLSPTVDPWERTDENQICPEAVNSQKPIKAEGALFSACPIEDGVVSTPTAGAISLARLMGGICAGLQPLQISLLELIKSSEETETDNGTPEGEIEDEDRGIEAMDMSTFRSKLQKQWERLAEPLIIDNAWAATIAGDLGEVIVRQGPRLSSYEIGVSGKWDDSILPKSHIMDTNSGGGFWEITAAEIRGGFDGLILSTKIAEWEQQVPNLRLSQILEMYYSNRGIDMDRTYRACSRKDKLLPLVSSEQFEKQITNMARILLYRTPFAVQLSDEILVTFTHKVIDSFQNNLAPFVDVRCSNDEDMKMPNVNLTLVLGSTLHNATDAERFINLLMHEVDVSPHGSSISILDGQTGNPLVNQTMELVEVFQAINSTNIAWPSQLHLGNAFRGIYNLQAASSTDLIGGNGAAVLVLGSGASPQDSEVTDALQTLTQIRKFFPDLIFVIVANSNNQRTFQRFIKNNTGDALIVMDQLDIVSLIAKIKDTLNKGSTNDGFPVPKRIAIPTCNKVAEQFEAYIDLEEVDVFRIHPSYIGLTESLYVKFQGVDYGSITVCMSRSRTSSGTPQGQCKKFSSQSSAAFEILDPCQGSTASCQPVYFTVSASNSTGKCFELDCRYPGQVRYLVRPAGLKCPTVATGPGGAVNNRCSWLALFLGLSIAFWSLLH